MASPEVVDLISPLIEQFQNGGPGDRCLAARALADLGPAAEDAIPLLVAALRDADVIVRAAAAHGLSHIGRPAVAPLLAELAYEDVYFRRAVIVTLGQVGRSAAAAIPALTAALEDETLADAAAQALRNIRRSRLAILRAWFGPSLQWALGSLALLAAVTVALWSLAWLSQDLIGEANGPALSAAVGIGLLGSALGALIGGSRRASPGAVGGALVLGFGGACAGLLLGGVLGTMLEPIVRVLSRG
jgi:HEAT repeat protein